MKKLHGFGLILVALMSAPSAIAQSPTGGQEQKTTQPPPGTETFIGTNAPTKGEYLERAGDCVVCHTGPGEKPFSGGLKMGTPLGAIYTTNITPDKETGIGNYTYEDFARVMREGKGKDGHHLYPAMPYPSYAKVHDDEMKALYSFFMNEVTPVKRANSKSEIPWPLNMRWPLAAWNVIFADKAPYVHKADHDMKWNRGAYLVQGFGHCGSCHTPRGIFFQEKGFDEASAKYVAGGTLDNWYASSLRGDQVAGLARWSEDDIVAFLKVGHNDHASVFGSMIDVINNSTQYLNDDDLGAIATYLKSLPGNGGKETYAYNSATTDKLRTGTAETPGARAYLRQCADCHALDGNGRKPLLPPIAGNPVLMDKDAASLINVVLNGAGRIVVNGMPDNYRMPQFRVQLKDQDVADVVSFIRQGWGNIAPRVTADQVAKIRKETDPASDTPVILRMR